MRTHRYKPGESKVRKARRAFLSEIGSCMACGSGRDLTTHEIPRGADRHRAFLERAAWLCLCWPCNRAFANPAVWPLARQLALKLIRDGAYFDLAAINRIRGRAVGAIELSEVEVYVSTVFQGQPECES